MRIKPIVIVVVVLVLILITVYKEFKNHPEHIDSPKNIIIHPKGKLVEQKSKNKKLEPVSSDTGNQITIPTVFDNDPVVDIQLIISNNLFCYRHLSNVAQTKDYLKQIQMRVSKKQFNYYKDYTTYCEKLKQKHPEFQLTNKQRLLEQNKALKATSQWGRVINGEIDVDTLSDFEIISLLKQNDVNILSLAPKYLESYYQKIIHWDLEDVLQNHQYDYVDYIRRHSHQLYICNIGADCSLNSSIMARVCYRNSLSCGLTFQEYIQSILTQGQQADIQLAMSYLNNIYQQ